MAEPITANRLELIAAKARQLADDYKAGSLWPGDLARGLGEIGEQLDAIYRTREGQEGRNGSR